MFTQLYEWVFSSLWHFIGSFLLMYVFFYFTTTLAMTLYIVTWKAIMVIMRGWPPNTTDLNSVFKSDEVEQEVEKEEDQNL